MKHHILKLALGTLALAGLGFAGYKFMQRKKQEVIVQNHEQPTTTSSPTTTTSLRCPECD